jgi:hypothetical protein
MDGSNPPCLSQQSTVPTSSTAAGTTFTKRPGLPAAPQERGALVRRAVGRERQV